MDLGPVVVELLQHGIGDGAADAAADDADLLLAGGLGGLAQGTHEVLEAVAFLEVVHLLGGGAHDLGDDADRALLRVIVMDGQGDPLAVLIHTEDDELARLRLLGHQGSLDLKEDHRGLQGFLSHNAKHPFFTSFQQFYTGDASESHTRGIVPFSGRRVNRFGAVFTEKWLTFPAF